MAKDRILNPVEISRKEAKKKELKRNKKQRQIVRSNLVKLDEQKKLQAIQAAQEVRLEDIFLPPEPYAEPIDQSQYISDDDPLLSETIYVTPCTEGLKPPGCPPGVPPDLKNLISNIVAPFATNSNNTSSTKPKNGPKRNHGFHNSYKKSIYKKTKNETPQSNPIDTPNSCPPRVSVIESKPIIFKPKTTKFIPSSVKL